VISGSLGAPFAVSPWFPGASRNLDSAMEQQYVSAVEATNVVRMCCIFSYESHIECADPACVLKLA
jgi:hypothetical protein